MPLSLIEGALGGIGLFLLGMRLMSDGIRTVADARIRDVFTTLTSNRLYSMLFGMAAALAVNSGSAAVIFTIGLVNGGVLNTFQALSVLGGVLIGASLPLHIHIIPYSLISTPLIFSGVVLKFFARKRRYANAGDLLLGIGLLFLGLTLLEGAIAPLIITLSTPPSTSCFFISRSWPPSSGRWYRFLSSRPILRSRS